MEEQNRSIWKQTQRKFSRLTGGSSRTYWEIENRIFCIFITFSLVVVIINCYLTLYYPCFKWLRTWIWVFAKPAVYINSGIVVDTGAEYTRERFAFNQKSLLIARDFLERIVDDQRSSPHSLFKSFYQENKNKILSHTEVMDEMAADEKDFSKIVYFLNSDIEQLDSLQSVYNRQDRLELIDPSEFGEWSVSRQQTEDLDLCMKANTVFKSFFIFDDEKLPKVRMYFGTETGMFCAYPAEPLHIYDPDFNKSYLRCDEDMSGFYNPRCQDWYQNQKAHPEATTISDLYEFAGRSGIGLSQCVAISALNASLSDQIKNEKITRVRPAEESVGPNDEVFEQGDLAAVDDFQPLDEDLDLTEGEDEGRRLSGSERDFLGVLCIDYEYYRSPLTTTEPSDNIKGPPIYDNTYVLQIQNDQNSIQGMLQSTIIRAPVSNFMRQEDIKDHLYGDMTIQTGTFDIPAATNSLIYEESMMQEDDGYFDVPVGQSITVGQDDQNIQSVYMIFKEIDLSVLKDSMANSFEYFCFFKKETLVGEFVSMEQHLQEKMYLFWTPYFLFAGFCYIMICYVCITVASAALMMPIKKLTGRIESSAQNVRKIWEQRKEQETLTVEEKLYKSSEEFNIASMQVDLMSNFVKINREMNMLQQNFNRMAKIIFVSNATQFTKFTHQSVFDVLQAIQAFEENQNHRGASTCYMMLGYNLATQMEGNYIKSLKYMDKAIKQQARLVEGIKLEDMQRSMSGVHDEELLNQKAKNARLSRRLTRSAKAISQAELEGLNPDMSDQVMENQFVLAFRLYTRAIISHAQFLDTDEESRQRPDCLRDESKRVAFLSQQDWIGLDAIRYLILCLRKLPTCKNDDHKMDRFASEKKVGSRSSPSKRDTSPLRGDGPDEDLLKKGSVAEAFGSAIDLQSRSHHEFQEHEVSGLQLKNESIARSRMDQQFEEQLDDMLLNDQEDDSPHQFTDRDPVLGANTSITKEVIAGGQDVSSIPYEHGDEIRAISGLTQGVSDIHIEFTEKQTYRDAIGHLPVPRSSQVTRNLSTLGGSQTSFELERQNEVAVDAEELRELDGFSDFIIFVKLLIMEMKILLLPVYMELKIKKKNIQMSAQSNHNSNIAENNTIGKPNLSLGFLDYSYEDSESNSSSEEFDVNHPKVKVVNGGKLPVRRTQTSIYLSGNRQQTAKLFEELYHINLDQEEGAIHDDRMEDMRPSEEVDLVWNELQKLGQEIKQYSAHRMIQVKRYGLQITEKWELEQFFQYLKGLMFTNISSSERMEEVDLKVDDDEEEKSKSESGSGSSSISDGDAISDLSKTSSEVKETLDRQAAALKHFTKSMQGTDQVCNSTCKKTLNHMTRILAKQLAKSQHKVQEAIEAHEAVKHVSTTSSPLLKPNRQMKKTISQMHDPPVSNGLNFEKLQLTLQRHKTFYDVDQSSKQGSNQSKGQIFIQEENLDDSFNSRTKPKPVFPQKSTSPSNALDRRHERIMEHRRNEAILEYRAIDSKISWVGLKLSHHIITQQSIFFVLDQDFDHYQEGQSCRSFVWDTFNSMDDQDHFGLLTLDKRNTLCQIDLDRVGNNRILKQKMLYTGLFKEAEEFLHANTGKMALITSLETAMTESLAIHETKVHHMCFTYVSPLKWVVVLLGGFNSISSFNGLPVSSSVNVVFVFLTNETPERQHLEPVQQFISKSGAEGGILILRHRNTMIQSQMITNHVQRGLLMIQDAIKLYPSQKVPIIKEELNF